MLKSSIMIGCSKFNDFFTQSECFISAKRSYATLKSVYDIGSWFGELLSDPSFTENPVAYFEHPIEIEIVGFVRLSIHFLLLIIIFPNLFSIKCIT